MSRQVTVPPFSWKSLIGIVYIALAIILFFLHVLNVFEALVVGGFGVILA